MYTDKSEAGASLSGVVRLVKKTDDGRLKEVSFLDVEASGGARQLSLCGSGALSGGTKRGICFSKFHADIEISDFSSSEFPVGSVISFGEAEIVITGFKDCYPNLCAERQGCPLPFSAAFARALKGGRIKTGDELLIKRIGSINGNGEE